MKWSLTRIMHMCNRSFWHFSCAHYTYILLVPDSMSCTKQNMIVQQNCSRATHVRSNNSKIWCRTFQPEGLCQLQSTRFLEQIIRSWLCSVVLMFCSVQVRKALLGSKHLVDLETVYLNLCSFVGELIVSNYKAVSINNWLQNVSAT